MASRSGGEGRAARRVPGGGYALATHVIVGVGAAVAARAADGPEIAAGAVSAWAVQAVAFWRLVTALDAREDATRVWVAGIVARVGGLVVAGVAAAATGTGSALPASYGLTMLVLLLLEAAWLSRRPWPKQVGRPGTKEEPRPDDTGTV